MNIDFDPYAILGVAPDASIEEIKDAYRRAARRLHPDRNHHKGALAQFQDINAANEILGEPDNRLVYDGQTRRRKPREYDFSMRVQSSKRSVQSMAEPQVIYLLVEILPDPKAFDNQEELLSESHLNLTLVLDRSNSMKGPRLEHVKVAVNRIIDQLSVDDILSVVTFNDRAELVIPATRVSDKAGLKARVSMMNAFGGTEIFQGLEAGVEQNRQYLSPKLVNHVVLLTDGNTYGDHDQCVSLIKEAADDGIITSAMGLGSDWNEDFLDELASLSGGACEYINSPGAVVHFLNDHVRNLSNVFVERLMLSIAPDADVKLETAFKLSPNSQPLPIDEADIPLGNLPINRITSLLLQLEIPPVQNEGFRSVARLVARGDILANTEPSFLVLSDFSIGVAADTSDEEPPTALLDALGKLTLYRMQERAQEALEHGNVGEATRRLEILATRFFERGEEELAQQTLSEAHQVAYTNALSDRGRKALRFSTRMLLGPGTQKDDED